MKMVLIVDDKATNRELTRVLLEQSGYAAFEASDRSKAVGRAQALLPDLIVLDLYVPAPDGFEILERLRRYQRFAATPIVALTASAMQRDRERALSAGFTSYIAKPISLKSLRREMDQSG